MTDFSNLRPGVRIRPPAVARHVVFLMSKSENPRWVTARASRKKSWLKLCRCLADHINTLRGLHDQPGDVSFAAPDENADVEPPRYSLLGSSIIPINDEDRDGYRLRARVDVHTELFSITYILDRIGRKTRGALGDQFSRLFDPSQAKQATQWLFNQIWETSDLGAAREAERWIRQAGNQLGPRRDYGRLITDFRGIVIYPSAEWAMSEPSLKPAAISREPEKGRLDEILVEFAQKSEALVRAVADPHSAKESAAGGEAVVCGMLDGKALYAACLGEWGKGVRKLQPVRHLLVYAGHSEAQLGRLLRRMHVLGELRHAALIDYDPDPKARGRSAEGLRGVSRHIRALGKDISGPVPAGAAGTGRIAKQGVKPSRGGKTIGPSMDDLQGFVSRLSDLSQMVDGGLTYRVEQSRYYAEEFRRAITHLRLVRMGDWQPYNDFVERYILHLFARVDRIGNRYEALGRRVDRLLFTKQAELLESYTKGVSNTVGKIEDGTRALGDLGAKQAELLQVAEYFALVFLIYYVGSVLKYAAEHEFLTLDKENYIFWWALLMAFAGIWLFLWILERKIRHWFRQWMTKRRRRANKPETEPATPG